MAIFDGLVEWACAKCGSKTGCSCWERCSCGWYAEKGKACTNPNTTRCSTKLKYERRKRRGG